MEKNYKILNTKLKLPTKVAITFNFKSYHNSTMLNPINIALLHLDSNPTPRKHQNSIIFFFFAK